MLIQKIHSRFWIFNLYWWLKFLQLKKFKIKKKKKKRKKKEKTLELYSFCSFTMGHFVTWWTFVWRKNLWNSMADKRSSLQSLFIERWVCACFYTSFIIVDSQSRSNGFRLVLPIPKAWVFNVFLISSHWLLYITAKLKIIRLYTCIIKLDSNFKF